MEAKIIEIDTEVKTIAETITGITIDETIFLGETEVGQEKASLHKMLEEMTEVVVY